MAARMVVVVVVEQEQLPMAALLPMQRCALHVLQQEAWALLALSLVAVAKQG